MSYNVEKEIAILDVDYYLDGWIAHSAEWDGFMYFDVHCGINDPNELKYEIDLYLDIKNYLVHLVRITIYVKKRHLYDIETETPVTIYRDYHCICRDFVNIVGNKIKMHKNNVISNIFKLFTIKNKQLNVYSWNEDYKSLTPGLEKKDYSSPPSIHINKADVKQFKLQREIRLANTELEKKIMNNFENSNTIKCYGDLIGKLDIQVFDILKKIQSMNEKYEDKINNLTQEVNELKSAMLYINGGKEYLEAKKEFEEIKI